MVNFLFNTTSIVFRFCAFNFVLISDGQYVQRIYVCLYAIIRRQEIEQP